ncbi:hypothetical protein K3495_g7620 [Podosphaera aphanis]|nr:hypothetical protein K3495_g7620 [Podosphaera aphanis]
MINKYIIENICLNSAESEEQANKNRVASRNFQIGDYVWLNYRNITSHRPSKKLDFKRGGPFRIIGCAGKCAYKLDLPKSAKVHPVSHVSLLSPTASHPLPGQTSGPPPILETHHDDPEFEVDKVIGIHWNNGKLHYLVRFKGYGSEEDLSIPATEAGGFHDLVNEFHDMNP